MAPRTKPESKSVIRVGPAGWSYPDWGGYVYPSRQKKGFHEATYLAEYFDTIEINTSFYRLHAADTYARWAAVTLPAFRFAEKMPGAISHEGGLGRVGEPQLAAHAQALAWSPEPPSPDEVDALVHAVNGNRPA